MKKKTPTMKSLYSGPDSPDIYRYQGSKPSKGKYTVDNGNMGSRWSYGNGKAETGERTRLWNTLRPEGMSLDVKTHIRRDPKTGKFTCAWSTKITGEGRDFEDVLTGEGPTPERAIADMVSRLPAHVDGLIRKCGL